MYSGAVMKKLATAIAAVALIGTPALAADMAVKAPPPATAPVYTWTGWYVGGNVGYSWGSARTDIAGGATTITSFLGGAFTSQNPPVAFADSQTQRLNGVIGGGQVGYNYQFSPRWVLGFEADIQGSGEQGSNTFVDPFSATVCGDIVFTNGRFSCITRALNGTAVTAYDAKIGWFGTVRARLGVLITDQVLLYGTGGLAYGEVKESAATNVNGSVTNGIAPFAPGATVFSESKTRVGFAVGGGIEGKFSHWLPAGWTWKAEYLYVDLGSLDMVTPFPGAIPLVGVTTPFTGLLATHTHFADNIMRVGLNYQFH
jgi:outer membrane immunogenic protein